jgi:hypothetical protein
MADRGPVRLFVSCHPDDAPARERLLRDLAIPVRNGQISILSILPGADAKEARAAYNAADVAVALLSADYLADPFLRDVELAHLLARRAQGALELHLVHYRPCVYQQHAALATLSPLPGARAITALPARKREAAMARVAEAVWPAGRSLIWAGPKLALWRMPGLGVLALALVLSAILMAHHGARLGGDWIARGRIAGLPRGLHARVLSGDCGGSVEGETGRFSIPIHGRCDRDPLPLTIQVVGHRDVATSVSKEEASAGVEIPWRSQRLVEALSGVVLLPGGAPVPGTEVRIEGCPGGEDLRDTADQYGRFTLRGLPDGCTPPYRLRLYLDQRTTTITTERDTGIEVTFDPR